MTPASDIGEALRRLTEISSFARSATHDLNNHMAAILSFTELVLEALPEDHELRADIEEIRAAGVRAIMKTRELDTVARQLSAVEQLGFVQAA